MIVDDPIRLSWPRVSLNGRHPSSGRDAGLETPIGFNAAAMSSAYYAMSSVHPIIDSHCAAILLQNHNLRRNRRAVIFVDLIGRELFDSPWRNPSTCRNKHPPHCSPWPRTTKDAVFFFFRLQLYLNCWPVFPYSLPSCESLIITMAVVMIYLSLTLTFLSRFNLRMSTVRHQAHRA